MSRRLTKHKQRAALDLAELCLVVARAGAQELTTEDFQMVQFYMRDVLRHVRAAAKQCAVVMPDILREID